MSGDDVTYFKHAAIFAVIFVTGPSALVAETSGCRFQTVSGAKCISMPVSDFVPLSKGTALPQNASMVMNPPYYGLPAVDGFYRYYVVERHVYRVHPHSLEVLEHVGRADRRLW